MRLSSLPSRSLRGLLMWIWSRRMNIVVVRSHLWSFVAAAFACACLAARAMMSFASTSGVLEAAGPAPNWGGGGAEL